MVNSVSVMVVMLCTDADGYYDSNGNGHYLGPDSNADGDGLHHGNLLT